MENPKILIVDDDAPSRRLLRDGLRRYDWVSVCGEASDSRQAVEMMRELTPHLVFLDIELNDVSALDILDELKELGGADTRFVFYTTYSKYLMQALRMEAFDFLLKPYDPDELNLIMNRYKLACAQKHAGYSSCRPSGLHAGGSGRAYRNLGDHHNQRQDDTVPPRRGVLPV